MKQSAHMAAAIVGVGAIMPDALDAPTFWQNIKDGRYSVKEVPPGRWDPKKYYDPDPKKLDASYSKIGGWVTDWDWNPLAWKLPIPPKVSEVMDRTQKWAVMATREALADYGYPNRPLDGERTAVILGNAMGGDQHLLTAARALFPEVAEAMSESSAFSALPQDVRTAIVKETRTGVQSKFPEINEDTMPGELANIVAGRIASLFNFRGPNYTADAACASAMAAITSAIEGLEKHDFDTVISGGVDSNMAPSIFVKFCKIGALSATGSRPYAEGADGFVMGEGAALFVIKRLEDAERDGDKIYAVIRGIGGSSDGRGKSITAPNPVGQRLAIQRGWSSAGLVPKAGDLIEGHGTSTAVGDVAELESLAEAFKPYNLPPQSIPIGSVKSNIGHLKGAAGSAGILKATFALYDKKLPPSINFHKPNPGLDWAKSPFVVNTELKAWAPNEDGVRRAGVSAFGFGGTNFHVVMEEYIPGRIKKERMSVGSRTESTPGFSGVASAAPAAEAKKPPRGALVIGGQNRAEIRQRLASVKKDAEAGIAPPVAAPMESDLRAPVRIAIDYGGAAELAAKSSQVLTALDEDQAGRWKALRAKGMHIGRGPVPKVAFLFTGQGSQYVNMLRDLINVEPIIADTYAEADRVMMPLLKKKLTEYIFVDDSDEAVVQAAYEVLKQTEITQPAVLATETGLTRVLADYGVVPDMVMGHSLGEYGALVASGALPFDDGLRAVSARGGEMSKVSKGDKGQMAAAWGAIDEIQKILDTVDGYVVVANINSRKEAVIGGASDAVQEAMVRIREAGFTVTQLQVSHAFHTEIVGGAADALVGILDKMNLKSPEIPVVANITGEFYPMGAGVKDEMVDILARQVASPVQFVKGLNTLYDAGARLFIELGPKRALYGFATDVVGHREDVVTLFTNHPRIGDVESFNQALCGLYAAGLGVGEEAIARDTSVLPASAEAPKPPAGRTPTTVSRPQIATNRVASQDKYVELGRMFTQFLDSAFDVYAGGSASVSADIPTTTGTGNVVVTGASIGLPGVEKVFDDANVQRILNGGQFIGAVPDSIRERMADKHIIRLVKTKDGSGSFETIDNVDEVIKLAARGGDLDLAGDFGFPEDRLQALDLVTQLAIAAGIDALRDAGIPMVMRYKTTTKGTQLPDRWGLPDNMRDDTGVIFASAFPGFDSFAGHMKDYYEDRARRERLVDLEELRTNLAKREGGNSDALDEIDKRIGTLRDEIEKTPFQFDRRFLFRVLSMGHSQFAEYIGARGPNTSMNGACASAGQAVAMARDWIAAGRCSRVVVISADNITSDNLMEWFGAGFLASGAAATDERVEDAAIPFDRRRHGLIIGMGGAALVLESHQSAGERGVSPICEILATATANSAFHGTRLNVDHICQIMDDMVSDAERTWGVDRHQIAKELVFVSHETYTPARGGSASAEVYALRHVFGESVDKIVIANTKGYTGHPMGVGVEESIAVKILETGIVPPVPNFKEIDPELGALNLSKGGQHPIRYALRLAAGFGSQIGMALMRWIPAPDGKHRAPNELGYGYRIADPDLWRNWLNEATGYDGPEIEVYKRTLRVKDQGPAAGFARPTVVSTPPVTAAKPTLAPAAADTPPKTVDVAEPIEVLDPVQKRVLEIVAEKSGYPPDMLELDLDLEADLGIDTVKQAEMFAAIREAYDIPRDENLKLSDFPTLTHTVGFVYDRRPDLKKPDDEGQPATTPAIASTTDAGTAAAAVSVDAAVTQRVLQVVSEQTGYPVDMLDLDLDLEADLGIDTVKQAEMFAAIREAYDIPRDENLKLGEFPTLEHTVQFVYDKRPDLAPGARSSVSPGPVTDTTEIRSVSDGGTATSVVGNMDAANQAPRRVPVPHLRPTLDLCSATGVDLEAGSRVIVCADRGGVGKALIGRLEKLGVETLVIDDTPTALALTGRIERWVAEKPVQGIYWLPALDVESPFTEMDLGAWREATRVRVKLLYTAARATYEQIGAKGTFLVSATRLGGKHGYDDTGAVAPLGGAVAGFTKAFKREKPEALVKVVDFEAGRKTAAIADRLIDETRRDPGVVEVGYHDGHRWTIGLEERPLDSNTTAGVELDGDSVFVITGAAGSIVSAITGDLAAASGGTFHLLDLAPAPDPNDADIQKFTADREGLKRDIFERLKSSGERATPKNVERELGAIERRHAALTAIQSVEAAGGTAHYYSVDLTDGEGVAAAMKDVAATSGRVDVLLHAGGLEISRLLPDKSPEEFDLVFDVKADGWFNVVSNLGDMPLGAAVVFSSIAGRFGNAGQTDYSSANDLLCKSVSGFRTSRPGTVGIALDWTAWSGIGMASRGSIPVIMEQAGIDMLDPEAGIPIVRRELTAGGPGEVVIAGSLGMMQEEFDETGGLDVEAVGKLSATTESRGIMTDELRGMGLYTGLTVETELDPKQQPFLYDHQINETPVLPGVMGIEAIVEAAKLIFPDRYLGALEDVTFEAPFKFYRGEPRTVSVHAFFKTDGKDIIADCCLDGSRRLHGKEEPEVTTHFTARVRLVSKPPKAAKRDKVTAPAGTRKVEAGDIYRLYFHGPAYQVVANSWRAGDELVGLFNDALPANHQPENRTTLTDPRLIELCFQTAGLFELADKEKMGLPYRVGSVEFLKSPSSVNGRVHAAVTAAGEDSFDAQVVDDNGDVYMRLKDYRTMALPDPVKDELLKPLKDIID